MAAVGARLQEATWGASRSFLYILVVSLATVTALHLFVPAFDPETFCCDHLFYRAQAVEWMSLDNPNYLSIPPGNSAITGYDAGYWNAANGLTSQPPYVYRPGVPLVAGLLGHILGVNAGFQILNAVGLFVLSLFTGLAVASLSRRLTAALVAAVLVVVHPQMISFVYNYMMVDTATLAVVAVTLYLMVSNRLVAAATVATVIGPLVRETLVSLALVVAIYALVRGRSRVILWILAAVGPLIQLLLRLFIPVPAPPGLGEIFNADFGPAYGFQAATSFILAFGVASVLAVGVIARSSRVLLVVFGPLIGLLLLVNSSQVTDGLRVWMALWPVIIVLGLTGLQTVCARSWQWWTALGIVSAQCVLGAFAYWAILPLTWNTALLMVGFVFLFAWSLWILWSTQYSARRDASVDEQEPVVTT